MTPFEMTLLIIVGIVGVCLLYDVYKRMTEEVDFDE